MTPKYQKYGLFGGMVAALSYSPFLFLCAQVAFQIGEANDYNCNAESFMVGYFCMPFVMMVGFWQGKVGGALGAKRGIWLGILLAFLGGVLVPLSSL